VAEYHGVVMRAPQNSCWTLQATTKNSHIVFNYPYWEVLECVSHGSVEVRRVKCACYNVLHISSFAEIPWDGTEKVSYGQACGMHFVSEKL